MDQSTSLWVQLIVEKLTINPDNWLSLNRSVRFGENDPAGVIHFHQLLKWCHESWEESLQKYGINLSEIFPSSLTIEETSLVALPIVHCKANFWAPIRTGDDLLIKLSPKKIDLGTFEVETKFHSQNKIVAEGLLRHKAINSQTRLPCELPDKVDRWIEASSLKLGVSCL